MREQAGLGLTLRLTRDREGRDLVLSSAETERAEKEAALLEKETVLARVAELERELARRAPTT